ncbi:hypothetical protein [Fontibacter flavus]|uniref:Uncharacterized protein n=1 Tax=Fontibacter flavus TaxID=654838 RepID=A0ABV6FZC6_9BACT
MRPNWSIDLSKEDSQYESKPEDEIDWAVVEIHQTEVKRQQGEERV